MVHEQEYWKMRAGSNITGLLEQGTLLKKGAKSNYYGIQ